MTTQDNRGMNAAYGIPKVVFCMNKPENQGYSLPSTQIPQTNEQLASFDHSNQLTPQMMMKLHDCRKYNKLCGILETHQTPFSILNLLMHSDKFGEILQNPQLRQFFEHWFTELKLALDCKATSRVEITPEVIQEKLIHLPRVRQTKSTHAKTPAIISLLALKTLIFDLDETLIHNKEYSADPVDAVIPYRYPDQSESEVRYG